MSLFIPTKFGVRVELKPERKAHILDRHFEEKSGKSTFDKDADVCFLIETALTMGQINLRTTKTIKVVLHLPWSIGTSIEGYECHFIFVVMGFKPFEVITAYPDSCSKREFGPCSRPHAKEERPPWSCFPYHLKPAAVRKNHQLRKCKCACKRQAVQISSNCCRDEMSWFKEKFTEK